MNGSHNLHVLDFNKIILKCVSASYLSENICQESVHRELKRSR